MGRELFLDFFTEHEVPVIRKRRHAFLKMDDENVYILGLTSNLVTLL